MDFKVGQIVTINKEIATEDFLSDCYFCEPSKERVEILKDTEHIITSFTTETLRSGKKVKAAHLKTKDIPCTFCWIPLIALIPIENALPELKIGTILETRGKEYFIIANENNAFVVHPTGGKETIRNWDKNTGKHCFDKDFDIVAVYDSKNICGFGELSTATPIWTEHTPAREMTVAEIEKELGHGVKVVGEDGTEYSF